MISELRLAQIIATITELSEQKKQDLYKFLIDLRNKSDSIITDDKLRELTNAILELRRSLGNKVDKITGKSLSSNDFTNELRTKLVTIVGNVQANWNTTNENDPSYIANKPDLSDVGVQSDWNETDDTKKSFIKNKPTIPTVPSQNDLDNRYELKSNKVTSISAQSTDLQYPSAKCVYDIVGDIESALQAILN